jgi:hypothetical protein
MAQQMTIRTLSQAHEQDSAVTLTFPLSVLGPLPPLHLAPPALVSCACGAEHVGMTPDELRNHLAWMSRDPRWRSSVIEASRKRRFARPEDVIASLRDRCSGLAATPAASEHDDGVAELCADLGVEDVPRAGRTSRPARRTHGGTARGEHDGCGDAHGEVHPDRRRGARGPRRRARRARGTRRCARPPRVTATEGRHAGGGAPADPARMGQEET